MTYQQPRRGGSGIVAVAFGVFVGSYLSARRRRARPPAQSPLAGLSARQAMTAAAFGRVVGLVVMAVYAAYYVDAMWHLSAR